MGSRLYCWCWYLTFYDSKSGNFAALGHPITDVDTGTILSVDKGELISSL